MNKPIPTEKSEEKKWLDHNKNQLCDNLEKSVKHIFQTVGGISEEFKERFGYAGASGTFQGVRDDEIIRWAKQLQEETQRAERARMKEIIDVFHTETYDPVTKYSNPAAEVCNAIQEALKDTPV